jgi:hypothetical protein
MFVVFYHLSLSQLSLFIYKCFIYLFILFIIFLSNWNHMNGFQNSDEMLDIMLEL